MVNIMKRGEKRELLKSSIFEAAYDRIEQNGLTDLRARDIAQDAGCSLGSLYNAFEDVDDLILNVNSKILLSLSDKIQDGLKDQISAEDTIVLMAKNYLNFAYDNYNLWSSLFGHTMQDRAPIPDWYTEQTNETFLMLVSPLIKLRSDLDQADAFMLVRTIFSAVHGIITINLQERFISIPRVMLQTQLVSFIKTYANGLQNQPNL